MALKAEEVLAIVLAKIKGGGTGEGDMKKSVYDPDHAVQTAGGIEEFVKDKLTPDNNGYINI